ncbi:unnamed protein product, partial [Rotaria socialis]
RYQIACFTRTTDQRIHVWDVRRAYLPQASFCHHRNDVEDFLWKPNSDNIISVDRDERLVHAHISSAIQSEKIVSLFSLNVTPIGCVHVAMPNTHNDYVHALCADRHISLSSVNIAMLYSQKTMSMFLNWNKMIKGESLFCNYSNSSFDDSIQLFHLFARRWTFGTGDKSPIALANICDSNSSVAEDLNRLDLKATWQVIKMLYVDDNALQSHRTYRRNNAQPTTTRHSRNDPINNHRFHYYQPGRRLRSIDQQQQHEHRLNEGSTDDETIKSQDQTALSDSKLEMIDDTDTYIVRDVLTDDIIFITPEDLSNNGLVNDVSYDNDIDIEPQQDSMPKSIIYNEPLVLINKHGDFQLNRLARQFPQAVMIGNDDGQMENEHEYHTTNSNTQTSIHSISAENKKTFFTIDEIYCPTIYNHSLNFDDIIRQTLRHYIDNNEIQVAVHILLALYPQLNERKRSELFNGVHLQWLVMYIELLQKMRLFIKAKQVTKHCIETEGIPLSYNPTEFDGTLIFTTQAPTPKRAPPISFPTVPSNNKNFPAPVKEFMCSICRIPCRRLFSFCGVCSHGGHIDHIQIWFKMHDECPYGCGHRCTYLDNRSRPSCLV